MLQLGASHTNNCDMILELFGYDIFAIICQTKTISSNFRGIRGILITNITNSGKARVMFQIGAGHSNNCQIILKLFRNYMFCNNLQHKKFFSKFGGIRGNQSLTLPIGGRLG